MSGVSAENPENVVVVIPTYSEAPTIRGVVHRVRTSVPAAEVVVVDDNSPDGTGEIADALAEQDPRVYVLHRTSKEGLGAAYVAGFQWALRRGYDAIVEMDADGSHQPEELPRLLAALDTADLVIGSRYVPAGKVVNWPRRRKLLSRCGNAYVRVLLGMAVRDTTAGFRVFRADTLRGIDLGEVASQGYCFQVDLAWRVARAGLAVAEVPITFVEREQGTSKMSGAVVREALWRVTQWGIAHRAGELTSWLGRRAR